MTMLARHRQRPDARPPASERELKQTEATASVGADTAGACAARARERLGSLAVRAVTYLGSCLVKLCELCDCPCRTDTCLVRRSPTQLYPIHRFPTRAPCPNVSAAHLKRPPRPTMEHHTHTSCLHTLSTWLCTCGELPGTTQTHPARAAAPRHAPCGAVSAASTGARASLT